VIAAIVLAAGGSQRMGQPKQLLPVGGQPMVGRVVDTVLAAGIEQVIVVLGSSANEVQRALAGKPVTLIVNPHWQEGIASSLRAGLSPIVAQADAVLFVPADMPRLSAPPIQAVVARFLSTGKAIVAPTCNGRRGNPVLFARPLFAELMRLRGDAGGRTLFAAHADDIELVEVGDEGILLDIDTPDEYDRMLRHW